MGIEASDIEDLPTLCQGQAADLKIETEMLRGWLCRVTGRVEYERLVDGRWVSADD